MSYSLLINNSHIYIYIEREREREREREIHTCCGGYPMMYNIIYSNTLCLLCIRMINLEFQVSHYLISRVFHK